MPDAAMKYQVRTMRDGSFVIVVTQGSCELQDWATYGLGGLFWWLVSKRKYPTTERQLRWALNNVEAYCAKHNKASSANEALLSRIGRACFSRGYGV